MFLLHLVVEELEEYPLIVDLNSVFGAGITQLSEEKAWNYDQKHEEKGDKDLNLEVFFEKEFG